MALILSDLRLDLSGRAILDGIALDIAPGRVTALIGPNGSGKSTTLRAMAGLVSPDSGGVSLNGTPLPQMSRREIARALAFLPQSPILPEGITVRGLVERGRTPHLGSFRPMTATDRAVVDRALDRTGLTALAARRAATLSGGQRQRAFIAMTLAQDTPVLLLDEPTTFLDLPYQIEVLRLVRALNQDSGQTVVMVLHDINLACRFADRVVGIRAGQVLFDGTPEEVVTGTSLEALYGCPLTVIPLPDGRGPMVLPE
ncbi:ABC transporter ATP-binding protein [Salipiger marinus]|uniref:Iron complex transport system ATP-binding protein n=1 Tax=Salipiger marinus TaxID=555512 RepID=A0A1G8QSC0_9RHOB|nr:ABC transporter ATP-binding protein [Salipiger marinus]SDJ07541.1 iron complex transport system ATP-binding protein [Salipiger marinus]